MKNILKVLSVAIVLVMILSTISTVHSQVSEPTAIIDAAYKDLSQRLGQTITRQTLNGFNWAQNKFPDSSLGCPKPGQAYAQVVTPGYQILIDVNGKLYDYRATLDGKTLFLCTTGLAGTAVAPLTGSFVGQPTPTAVPLAAIPQGIQYTNPSVFVGPDGNVTITMVDGTTNTIITNNAAGTASPTFPFYSAAHVYGQFRWSPDGTKLLYTDRQTNTLYEVVSGKNPISLATGIAVNYPAAWSLDGSQIAYIVEPQAGSAQIQVIPTAGGQATTAVTFTEQTGCGDGTSDPADALYQAETGYQGNGQMLAFTAQGFLVTAACSGSQLELIGSDGKVAWQQADMIRTALSPDHAHAAAINQKDRLVSLIDLTNGNLTPVTTQSGTVDQIAWSADGNALIYSTLMPNAPVKGIDTSQVGTQLFPNWPVSAQSYTVTLWQQPLSSGSVVKLFSLEGRGIGVITPLSNTPVVMVSFINSSVSMIQQINAGKSAADVLAAAPHTSLLQVATSSGSATKQISIGGQPAADKGIFIAMSASSALLPTPLPAIASTVSTTIPPCATPPAGWVTYTVQAGDNLTSIATRSGSTVEALSAANCLTNANQIEAGQKLRVPQIPTTITPVPPPTMPIATSMK